MQAIMYTMELKQVFLIYDAYYTRQKLKCFKFLMQTVRIGADEEVDDFKGMTEEEVKEVLEEKEAKANAQILEMVRGI